MPTVIPSISNYELRGSTFVVRSRLRHTLALLLVLSSLLFLLVKSEEAVPMQSWTERPPEQPVAAKESVPDTTLPDTVRYIRHVNSQLSEFDATHIAYHVIKAARSFEIDLPLFLALIRVESGYKPEAVSDMGAQGLTQVIPKWHLDRISESRKVIDAYSLFEPRLNVYVGAWALRDFIDSSGGNITVGLLKYNGSRHDTQKVYAKLVFSEASNVRANFVRQGA